MEAIDLTAYRWKKRLLFVFALSEEDQTYYTLKKEIAGQDKELNERDLSVFYVLEKGESRLDWKRIEPAQALFLRKHFSVPSGKTMILLIGKDGGEKLRQDGLVEMKQIFRIIDAMPMRQEEMKRNLK
jgi:hypothetical protein